MCLCMDISILPWYTLSFAEELASLFMWQKEA